MQALRPDYTEHVYKLLQKQSLNVYGLQGQGRGRLLEDVQALAEADGHLLQRLDMKAYARSYEGFCEAFKALPEQETEKKVFLLLHHFDAILDNAALGSGYGVDFFNLLNAFKNRGNCSLLCVTEKPYLQYRFYAEKIHNLSPLDLFVDELTALSFHELRTELRRWNLGLDEDDFSLLLQAVARHDKSYAFLDYVCNRIDANAYRNLPFKQQLKRWGKDFKSERRRGLLYALDGFGNLVGCFVRELGKLSKTMKTLLAGLATFAGVATGFFKKIGLVLLEIVQAFGFNLG